MYREDSCCYFCLALLTLYHLYCRISPPLRFFPLCFLFFSCRDGPIMKSGQLAVGEKRKTKRRRRRRRRVDFESANKSALPPRSSSSSSFPICQFPLRQWYSDVCGRIHIGRGKRIMEYGKMVAGWPGAPRQAPPPPPLSPPLSPPPPPPPPPNVGSIFSFSGNYARPMMAPTKRSLLFLFLLFLGN